MYKNNSGNVYKYSVYVDVYMYFIMDIIKGFKLRLFIFILIYN